MKRQITISTVKLTRAVRAGVNKDHYKFVTRDQIAKNVLKEIKKNVKSN